jgi:hypothetical protein
MAEKPVSEQRLAARTMLAVHVAHLRLGRIYIELLLPHLAAFENGVRDTLCTVSCHTKELNL